MPTAICGHRFTGAQKDRTGIIKKIDGGTLLLDELPEISKHCQAMLLRFLQDGRIKPMGSDCYDDDKYNVRIICAGQPQLLKKNLREDLLYRLGEVKIDVPALKEINEYNTELKTNSEFMEDFQAIISKHRECLPSSENLKLSYTYLVSHELTEKTQKHIAKDVLNISESTRKKYLEDFECL